MDNDAYLALRESAAVFDLTGRGHLQTTGEDRVRLLHAMSSNHIEGLKAGECCYAFFLSSQGRILADANLIRTESSILLDTEPETAASLHEHLDRYIIADDVTIANLTSHVAVFGLEGPQSPAVLERMGIEIPGPGRWTEWRTWVVAALSATGERGFRFVVPIVERDATRNWIAGAGAIEADRAEWNTVRLENGVPRYGEDITEREIPHETGLVERAISFHKGCYLGQEIVERVRSRGQVNRKLVRLRIAGQSPPGAHTKLHQAGKEVGEITSAAFSPALGGVVALGYARAQTILPGATFQLEGAAGITATLTAPQSS